MKPPVPFLKSYWVLPGKFLAGPYPVGPELENVAGRMADLVDAGIRHIVSLQEPAEFLLAEERLGEYLGEWQRLGEERGLDLRFSRFPVVDMAVPSRDGMKKILDVIDHSIGENRTVYLHCWGGRGRTGTVVGSWLARHGYAAGNDVLDKIDSLRKDLPNSLSPSPETEVQRMMVILWEKGE